MALIKRLSIICFAFILIAGLVSCDFRLMSKWEVETQLEQRYGQEFTVLSSASVTDDYYDDDVWRVKAYVVAPDNATYNSF